MKKILSVILMILSTIMVTDVPADAKIQDLGQPGTKTVIGKDMTLTYSFNVRPAMGMVILKIKVTGKDGKPVDGLVLTGISDMPEMRDSNSGKVTFLKNKKKDFLLPVDITMPGKWQVTVLVEKQKKLLLTGMINFNV